MPEPDEFLEMDYEDRVGGSYYPNYSDEMDDPDILDDWDES